ncbi:hypothetical protein [Azohydromonas australica]|uniref:hypothetical protein n=1 Tax=Azohydromonas australica TaxID=364039 RepID=UPI000429C2F6|nr:hypothetical protein [Azohydromonas australica]
MSHDMVDATGDAWAAAQLVRSFEDSDQKKRLAGLDPVERETLAGAIALVADRKAAAYARALSGELPGLAAWMKRDPELAQATALLNKHFLAISSIPARPGVPAAGGVCTAPASEHDTAADQAQQALAF